MAWIHDGDLQNEVSIRWRARMSSCGSDLEPSASRADACCSGL